MEEAQTQMQEQFQLLWHKFHNKIHKGFISHYEVSTVGFGLEKSHS